MTSPDDIEHGQASGAQPPSVSRRTALRLIGLGAGGLAFGGGLAAYDMAMPQLYDRGSRMYDYAYLRDKYKSPEFAFANRQPDSLMCFGSSEFKITPDIVPQVPQAVFGGHDHAFDLWFIGEGYDQSLWHAIAFGAYASRFDIADTSTAPPLSRKVAFFISPQWFFEGGVPANATRALFSYHLWSAFCANANVPDDCKAYARQRLIDMGVPETSVWAATHNSILDSLNDVALSAIETEKVRNAIDGVRQTGGIELPSCKVSPSGSEGTPDWDALKAEALASGAAACTTNEYYIYDDYWNQHNASDYAAGKLEGFFKWRTLLKAPTEDADLACALEVANACSLEVMAVLMPVPGPWYDYEQFSYDDRQQRYELMRKACSDAGVSTCDLTDREYEPYFTCDGTHLGWTGWVAVEKALYEFAKGE